VSPHPLPAATPATLIPDPDPRTVAPGATTAPEETAVTAAIAVSPASLPDSSAAAPAAVLEAAPAAATMAAPNGAITTPGAAATPATPVTDFLL
jgi:hypothetical protein